VSGSATFLGVGEACDPRHGNTAVLLRAGAALLLLDCVFSVPHRLFARVDEAEALDGIWISHAHGDHCFGLPLCLLRLWEMGRRRPLRLLGQAGLRQRTLDLLELAYPGFFRKLRYPIEEIALEPGVTAEVAGVRVRAAWSEHSQPNLGVRLDWNGGALYYSGDGRMTPDTVALMEGADLVVHEAFRHRNEIHGHGSVESCLRTAASIRSGPWALVHLERRFRQAEETRLRRLLREQGHLLPDDGDEIAIPPARAHEEET